MIELLLLAAEAGHDAHPLLDPHGPGLVFWTAIIFAIVSVILYYYAWGPILEALKDREAAITGQIEEAEKIGAEITASECPSCTMSFNDGIEDKKSEIKFKDLSQIVVEALGL